LDSIGESNELAKTKFNVDVIAFVSDNESAVKKAGVDCNLINYTCMAHTANLFIQDIHDEELYNKVHSILVVFKNTRLAEEVKLDGGSSIYIKGKKCYKQMKFLENF
jgi:hypothetical protein